MRAPDAEPLLVEAVMGRRLAEVKHILTTGADVNVRSPNGNSVALHVAALNGHHRIASTLLNHGADKDALDQAGETPLMKAVKMGHESVLEILLAEGADTDVSCAYYGRSALHLAVGARHDGMLTALLDHGANENARDAEGYTPLAWAISAGGSLLPLVKTLLQAGADLNIPSGDCNDCVALHVAARVGDADAIALLLLNGADIDVRDKDGDTPLVWAIRSHHLGCVEVLLHAGAKVDVRSTDDNGFAALHVAADQGSDAMVYLLLEFEADINILNNLGETAAIRAVGGGHKRVVQTLSEFGANFTIATARNGYTPLHFAVHLEREDIVKILSKGVDTLIADHDGETPLMWAARGGNARLVEIMMADRETFDEDSPDGCVALRLASFHGRDEAVDALLKGVNKDALDCDGERPLIWAVAGGHLPMVKALVAAGFNVNVRRGSDGCAPLHLAAGGGHDGILFTLLRAGTYKDILDNKGTTPLLWATAEGHLTMVRGLLAAGANCNIRSKEDGFSALLIAAGKGYLGIVSALLRGGAGADMVDHNGDTALMWAAGNGHLRVVEALLDGGADVSVRNDVEGFSALDWAARGKHRGVQKAIQRRLAHADADDDGDGVQDRCTTDTCLDSGGADQVDDVTQALIEEEFNFYRREQAKIAGSASLAESVGGSLRGLLLAPTWLDAEGVLLAVAMLLWFSCRCRLRS